MNKPTPPKAKRATGARRFKDAGQWIADARTQAGLSQVQLATACDFGQNRETAIEKSPNLTLLTMCSTLARCKSDLAPQGFEFVLQTADGVDVIPVPPGCKSFGTMIVEARAKAKLTQVALAKLCKIGQNRESAIEKSTNLTYHTLCSTASRCGYFFAIRKREGAAGAAPVVETPKAEAKRKAAAPKAAPKKTATKKAPAKTAAKKTTKKPKG
jgi:transcriptional regulator with XRE-family HTH domain